ncbi:hypothetical protein F1880_009826 [Penicillium rolfsii]|nr:hypothetical protein F1880_009826 [Penicillium rolfsii]
MAEPERRRRRPAVNCIRSKNSKCEYAFVPPLPRRTTASEATDHQRLPESNGSESSIASEVSPNLCFRNISLSQPPVSAAAASRTSPSTSASLGSIREAELIRRRIEHLEEQLSKVTQGSKVSTPKTPNTDSQTVTTSSRLAGTFHMNHETPTDGHAHPITRFMMHKTRVFGQSHWMSGVAQFGDILLMIDPIASDETSKVILDLQKCKNLGRMIKERRRPPWPTALTSDLPPKELADTLVDIYLRTTETFYRVFHIPSFRQEYDAVWSPGSSPQTSFLVRLKLVFAIGATMYDDRFTLRPSAIRWIYEAQTWISEPEFKSRLNIQFLQTQILLLLAREIVGVEGSFIWISAGELVRNAMYMGLHRDPEHLPKRTTFVAEFRRRIWNTVLEISLYSSIESGGNPLLSLEDFDTHLPQNSDDEQIMLENPTVNPEHSYTQMSIALALRRMFPIRLAIAKRLNGIGDYSRYTETLRLDAELRASYKIACKNLQAPSSAGTSSLSDFQKRYLDLIFRRYIVALHTPYFAASQHECTYAFSRKAVVESSLKIWNSVVYNPSTATSADCVEGYTQDIYDFQRMSLCGDGSLRTCAAQACFLIASDLRAQIEEEEGLGPKTLRPDQLSLIKDSISWSLDALRAGETNAKCYMFFEMVSTMLDGLQSGLRKDQLSQMLVESAEGALAKCIEVFETILSEDSDEIGPSLDDMTDLASFSLPELISDWGFLSQWHQFDLGVAEPMNWVYTGYP